MAGKLFGAATIAALAFGLQPVWAQDSVKIGFVSTFSGSQAAIGEDMRRSVDLAVEHLGGKIAGKKIEIVYEDDQFKPDVGKARSEKLVQQDKVNFVAGYIWSNVLLASLKTVTDEGDTILISANAGPSQIAGELCNKNFFSTSWQNDQTPMAMGEYLNTKGVKSLYVVAPNYAAGKDMARRRQAHLQGQDRRRGLHQVARPARLLGRADQDRRRQAGRHLHLLSRRARRAVRQAVGAGRPQQDRAALPGVLDRRDHPAAAGRAGARHAGRPGVGQRPAERRRTRSTSRTSRRSTRSTRPTTARRATTRSC